MTHPVTLYGLLIMALLALLAVYASVSAIAFIARHAFDFAAPHKPDSKEGP